MIIDFHTHAFTDALAPRAIGSLERIISTELRETRTGDGTVGSLLHNMDEDGVDRAVVLNIATLPHSARDVNEFAAEVDGDPRLIGFGSVHPFMEKLADEIDWIKDHGLKGIKLHAHYQRFFADDMAVYPMYEMLEKAGLMVVIHGGFDPFAPKISYNPPIAARAVHDAFPGLTLVEAHMGGMYNWDEVEEYIVGTGIYIDTALADGIMDKAQMTRIIKNHGADKVLLGSDSPWHSTAQEIACVRDLPISESDKALILGGNAMRLLGIDDEAAKN